MKKLFLYISNRGVKPGMDEDSVEEIQILNGIGFTGLPICLFYFVLFAVSGHIDRAALFLVGIPIFNFSVIFIHLFGFRFCRATMCILIPVIWYSITVAFGRECGFYLGFIVTTFPPFLFFRTVRGALPFVIFGVFCMIGSVITLAILNQPSVVSFAMAIYGTNLIVALLAAVVIIIFFREQILTNRLILREQKKEIVDSINYASRIQSAIMASKSDVEKIFPDSFVYFKPKSIVSGDFYWFSEKNGKRLAAAVDCTGHGVPGAFMSMIGNSFLDEIVNEQGITEPAEILNRLREKVITSLKQREDGTSQKDGMDMTIIAYDSETNAIEFAGAKNPIYYIREGKLNEMKGDKMPVGIQSGSTQNFTNHTIPVIKGDVFYLFTDGFADQFGGPAGKKYKYSTFKEYLTRICAKPMTQQPDLLHSEFESWHGQLEQIDDVCILGIRI